MVDTMLQIVSTDDLHKLRWAAVGCITPILTISFTFAGMYMDMWITAMDADKEFSDKLPAAFTDDYPYYDTCGRGV